MSEKWSPPLPPTKEHTLFASCWLLVTSSVAVCALSDGGGIGPIVAVQVPTPDVGS
jgi:hypothetical protein